MKPDEAKISQINIEDYTEQKATGKIVVQKVGRAILLVKAKWDSDSGENIDPLVVPINSEMINKQIEAHMKHIKAVEDNITLLKLLLTDVVTLEKE